MMSIENDQVFFNYGENHTGLIACDYFIIYLPARTGKHKKISESLSDSNRETAGMINFLHNYLIYPLFTIGKPITLYIESVPPLHHHFPFNGGYYHEKFFFDPQTGCCFDHLYLPLELQ